MSAALCIALFCASIAQSEAHTAHSSRAKVCEDVATEAEAQGVDPVLAVAVSWRESAFTRSAVSKAGAVGPLQVMPRFWCKSKPCDHIEAGIRALRYYTERHGIEGGLCAYFSGKPCELTGKTSRRYMRSVLKIRQKFDDLFLKTCGGC